MEFPFDVETEAGIPGRDGQLDAIGVLLGGLQRAGRLGKKNMD